MLVARPRPRPRPRPKPRAQGPSVRDLHPHPADLAHVRLRVAQRQRPHSRLSSRPHLAIVRRNAVARGRTVRVLTRSLEPHKTPQSCVTYASDLEPRRAGESITPSFLRWPVFTGRSIHARLSPYARPSGATMGGSTHLAIAPRTVPSRDAPVDISAVVLAHGPGGARQTGHLPTWSRPLRVLASSWRSLAAHGGGCEQWNTRPGEAASRSASRPTSRCARRAWQRRRSSRRRRQAPSPRASE